MPALPQGQVDGGVRGLETNERDGRAGTEVPALPQGQVDGGVRGLETKLPPRGDGVA